MEPTSTTLTGAAMLLSKGGVISFLAGLIGATVSLKFVPNLATWEKFTTVLAGAMISHFTSGPVSQALGMQGYYDTVCFLLGLFGLSFCAAILNTVRDLDILAIIYSKLNIEPTLKVGKAVSKK